MANTVNVFYSFSDQQFEFDLDHSKEDQRLRLFELTVWMVLICVDRDAFDGDGER